MSVECVVIHPDLVSRAVRFNIPYRIGSPEFQHRWQIEPSCSWSEAVDIGVALDEKSTDEELKAHGWL